MRSCINIYTNDDLSPPDQECLIDLPISISKLNNSLNWVIPINEPAQYLYDFQLCSHPVKVDNNSWYIPHQEVNKAVLLLGTQHFTLYNKGYQSFIEYTSDNINTVETTDLDFLGDVPILQECNYRNQPLIELFFNRPPHCDFWLRHRAGYICDQQTKYIMRNSVVWQSLSNGGRLIYDHGNIV